jgi:hypothetical protein
MKPETLKPETLKPETLKPKRVEDSTALFRLNPQSARSAAAWLRRAKF